jgi:hypothetical protein
MSQSGYAAIRAQSFRRVHWFERIADGAFIAARLLLAFASFVVTDAAST